MSTSQIEKTNLEAHVELCAERYAALEEKLDTLSERLDKVEVHIVDIKQSIQEKTGGVNKTLFTSAVTIIGVMFSAIIILLINLVNK